jgi:PAS domain S-box-containing protein
METRINDLADNVERAFTQYENLSYLQEQLKLSFILILTMVLLFSIFSVVWAAFYSAQNLVSPIRDLAQGTRSVAEGDYNTQLPVPSHDELGFLVSSFNEMTRRISQARDEVRQSQYEAEAQKAYIEAVFSRLSSGVMVLDEDSRLRTANISCGQILGIDIDEVIGKTLNELQNKYHYLEKFLQTIEQHLKQSDQDWREQVPIFGTSGRLILMGSGTSIRLASESEQVHVVVFDDITALIQGQRDAAWSEMARRLAHEIKNPLTPIKLAAERLRHKYAENLSEEQFDPLDRLTNTIIHQVETMKTMVNSFSEYARPPSTSATRIDVNALLQEVVDLFENLDDNAEISMNLETDLPLINADPDKLRRVFNNLIKNAFDASLNEPNVSLDVSTHYSSGPGPEYIEIEIRDSGTGMTEDILSTIFEPYVTTKSKGTGLGLAIVKKIIEEHGGIVMLKNNSDKNGASAIIRLPISGENIETMKLAMSNREIL